MGTKVTNLPVEVAQARLAAQLEPRSEGASGTVNAEDYERTIAEQERLQREVQIGHGPKSRS